jgi:hypothetical protein
MTAKMTVLHKNELRRDGWFVSEFIVSNDNGAPKQLLGKEDVRKLRLFAGGR